MMNKAGKFAVYTAFLMAAVGIGGKASAQAAKATESYTVKEVIINMDQFNNATTTIIATSDADAQGNFQTGSGLNTKLNLTLNDAHTRGLVKDVSDDRLKDVKIEYTNPANNNFGNFSAMLYAYHVGQGRQATSNVDYMAIVNGNPDLGTSSFEVEAISLHGNGVPIVINGQRTGDMAASLARQYVQQSTGFEGEGMQVAIDFTKSRRLVTPPPNANVTNAGYVPEQMQAGTYGEDKVNDEKLRQQQQERQQHGGFPNRRGPGNF